MVYETIKEVLILSLGESGIKLFIFVFLYSLIGLIIFVFKYSILGNKRQQEIWIKLDGISKIVYGFLIGFFSWIVAIIPTSIFYLIWGLFETPGKVNYYFGLQIIIFTFIYGFLRMKNNLSEKDKPLNVGIFILQSIFILFMAFSFFLGIGLVNEGFKEGNIASIIIGFALLLMVFLYPKAYKNAKKDYFGC